MIVCVYVYILHPKDFPIRVVRRPFLQPHLLLDCFQPLWGSTLIGWQEVSDTLSLHAQVGDQWYEGGAYQPLLHVTLHTHYRGDKYIHI